MIPARPTGKRARRVRMLAKKDHASQAKCEPWQHGDNLPCPRHDAEAYAQFMGLHA